MEPDCGRLSLSDMLRYLYTVDDITWGRYAFSFDILRNHIPLFRQDEMARKAVACGEEWARRMMAQTGTADPVSMQEALGLVLVENDVPITESARPIFAQFVPERRIEIMSQPLHIYSSFFQKETGSKCLSLFPPPEQVRTLLLAHEIFHYVEECNSKEIYSQTETIQLWKFLWIRWNSTVRALSEIAAMSFAKTLTSVDYSPFILDIILFHGCNKEMTENAFRRITDIVNIENLGVSGKPVADHCTLDQAYQRPLDQAYQ